MTEAFEVINPGLLTLIEDLGRPGWAHIGISRGGAMDRGALRLGNRLVGNDENAAGLEVLLGGLHLKVITDSVVVITGAATPVWVDDQPVDHHRALAIAAGSEVRLGRPNSGLRSYFCVRGGVVTEVAFGSMAASPVSGIGPAALKAGDLIQIGDQIAGPTRSADVAPSAAGGGSVTVRIIPGPRDDWFTPTALESLTRTPWNVSPQCDRVGIRLTGATLERTHTQELPSEPLVPGAIQVPSSGEPLIFMADHPTTGGYPVIGVVASDDLDALAQVRPGDQVRFELSPISSTPISSTPIRSSHA